MLSNVVLTSLIAGYSYLSFISLQLLVSFTLSHFKEPSPNFAASVAASFLV